MKSTTLQKIKCEQTKFKYYFRVVTIYLIHNSWRLTEIGSEPVEGFLQAVYVGFSNSTDLVHRTTYKSPRLFVWFPVKY